MTKPHVVGGDVLQTFNQAKAYRAENADIYQGVAEAAMDHPLPFSAILAVLEEEPRTKDMARAVLYGMAANDSRTLGRRYGTAYYLDFGGVYYKGERGKPNMTLAEARDYMRTRVASPAITGLQNVLDQMDEGKIGSYWRKRDRVKYERLAPLLHNALERWELVQYPFAERSVQIPRLANDMYTEVARLSRDHPLLSTEVREVCKLYEYDEESGSTAVANLSDDAQVMRLLGERRSVGYAIPQMYSYVYNQAKMTDERAAELIGPVAAEAEVLRIQRIRVTKGIAARLDEYLAQFAVNDIRTCYGG